MSTIGVKAIKYPDGDSAINITDGGNVTLAGTLGVTGAITGTLATAAQTNITSVGTLTSITVGDGHTIGNQSVSDNLEIKSSSGENIVYNSHYGGHIFYNDGTENFRINDDGELRVTGTITKPSGDLTLDVAGDIILDADGGDLIFKDGGTEIARFYHASENFQIRSAVSDKDIIFQGNDGGSAGTEIMRIDVSERRLGLGTDSPTEKLSIVNGSGDVGIRIQGNTRSFKIEQNNYGLRVVDLDASAERFRIDAAGIVTMPYQSAFGAHGTGTSTLPINVYTKIPVTVERFDQNGDFNTSTKIFTAPVAGRYHFSTGIYLYNHLDNEAGYLYFAIVTSNETYDFPTQSSIFGSDIGTFTMQGSALADLDAGDTAYAHIYQQGGTAQATISHGHTFFTGFLAC